MKRTAWFCTLPIILFVAILIFTILLPTQVSFHLTRVSGDASYEKNISYDIIAKSELSGVASEGITSNRLWIQNRKGKLSYSNDYFVKEKIEYKENELTFSNDVSSISKSTPPSIYLATGCKLEEEILKDFPVSYRLTFYTDEYGSSITPYEYNKTEDTISTEIKLETNLNYITNENVKVTKQMNSCDNEYQSIDRVYDDEKEYGYDMERTVKEYQGAFYFMPSTDENIVGQNRIYRMKLTKKDKDSLYYEKDFTPIINLPTERNYDWMTQKEENLYVLSHDSENNYLTNYDVQGNLIKEISLEKDLINAISTVEVQGNYLIVNDNKEKQAYHIFDMSSLAQEKIISTTELLANDAEFQTMDILYKDHVLYLLGLAYSDKNYTSIANYVVYAMDEKQILYKGTINAVKGTGYGSNAFKAKFVGGDAS